MATVTLRLAPRPAHVRTARLVASAMARRGGVPDDLLDDVRLAVGEACARAVRLHQRHEMDDAVTVELTDGDGFTVVVADSVASAPLGTSTDAAADVVSGDADGGPTGLVASVAGGQGRAGTRATVPPLPAGGSDPSSALPSTAGSAWAYGTNRTGGAGGTGQAEERWAASERLGLAVLAGVVDDLRVERGDTGTRVRMRWPTDG
ncbi:MAG TPA: ATP-binding protein [Mycobacteriales bacterium]|nr:ATP-binding protein [Mycobacteriales bacterium]